MASLFLSKSVTHVLNLFCYLCPEPAPKIRIKNKIKRRWFQRTTNNFQLTTSSPKLCTFAPQRFYFERHSSVPLLLCVTKKAAGLKLRPWEKGKGQALTADAVADHDEEEGAKTEQERVARRFGDCGQYREAVPVNRHAVGVEHD